MVDKIFVFKYICVIYVTIWGKIFYLTMENGILNGNMIHETYIFEM